MHERYIPDGRLYDKIRDMQAANLFALKLGLFATDAAPTVCPAGTYRVERWTNERKTWPETSECDQEN